MAIVGRKPKPEDQRRNQNPPRHDWIEVENKPFGDAPALPKLLALAVRSFLAWPISASASNTG